MNGTGVISVRLGKSGKKEWQAEQVCGGLSCPGPYSAELRAWVADDAELGKRVAGDLLSADRCLRDAGSALLRAAAPGTIPPGDIDRSGQRACNRR
jgi:hypothetical protein